MGKSRVKGIVVEVGGNTVGLDKALQGTNKNISNTQSQLRDVERLLKLDPKNTVLLEQKQKLLAQAVQETKEKQDALNQAHDQVKASMKNYDQWAKAVEPVQEQLDTTKKKLKELKAAQQELADCGEIETDAYKQLTEEVEKTSQELRELKKQKKEIDEQFGNPSSPEAFDSLQREIAQTEQDLKSLETAAEKNFNQIGDAVDTAKQKLEKLGTAAGNVKDKAAGVADTFQPVTQGVVALAGAAAATVPATEELREDLSRLDANALENAVSIDAARKAWKEFAVQSGETDSAVEAVSNLLQAGFTESNLQKAVEGLAGAAQRFPDTLKVESLADSLQETLATQSATGQFCELLERMGMDTEAFNTQLQECSTAAERQDLILQTLANAGLNDSYNAWKQNNAEMVRSKEANLTLEESMAKLAETVLPLMTDATEQIARFVEWIADLPDGAKAAIAGLLLLAGSISPVASAVSGAAGLIETMSKINLPGLGTAMEKISGTSLPGLGTAFSSVFGFIAANPVVLLIAAIVGLVALVATKSEECIEWLNMIDDFLQAVFAVDWTEIFGPVLGGTLNDFFALCKDVWDGVKLMLEGIIDFIAGVFSGDWERAWDGVRKIFQGIFDSLEGLLKAPINGVIKLVNTAISGINGLIRGVNKIPGINLSTIGSIPLLANGGEVLQGSAIVGDAGPELLTVLGDRTVVQPLTNNYHNTTRNMGGMTVNVYGAPGQDVRELAEAVAEEMQYLYESEEAAI